MCSFCLFSPLTSRSATLYTKLHFFCLWLTTITTVKTTVQHLCFQTQQYLKPLPDKQKKISLLLLSLSPLYHLFLFASPLWKLISSDVTELWKPWAEVLQMLCHHAKHGRKRTPSTALGCDLGKSAARQSLFDFSLYLSFQLHRQTVLCLPRSAGLVLILARENALAGKWWQGTRRGKGERWMPKGKILGSNDAYKK